MQSAYIAGAEIEVLCSCGMEIVVRLLKKKIALKSAKSSH